MSMLFLGSMYQSSSHSGVGMFACFLSILIQLIRLLGSTTLQVMEEFNIANGDHVLIHQDRHTGNCIVFWISTDFGLGLA